MSQLSKSETIAKLNQAKTHKVYSFSAASKDSEIRAALAKIGSALRAYKIVIVLD